MKLDVKKIIADPVLVVWEDAWAMSELTGTKDEPLDRWSEGSLRIDCGWLVEKNADFIMLSLTLDPPQRGVREKEYAGISRIPRSLVKKIIKLCPLTPSRRSRSKSRSSSPQTSPSPSASPEESSSQPGSSPTAESKPKNDMPCDGCKGVLEYSEDAGLYIHKGTGRITCGTTVVLAPEFLA